MIERILVAIFVIITCLEHIRGSSSAESYYQCDRYFIGRPGSGIITHDNYPLNYTERLNCRFRFFIKPFHPSDPWKICFTFQRFRLGDSDSCTDDYLEFVSGGHRYCGNGKRAVSFGDGSKSAPGNIFTSEICWLLTLNTFDILFSSGYGSTNYGFYANYTISDYDGESLCNVADTFPSSATLISANNCTWTTTECGSDDMFRCFTDGACVPVTQLCDGSSQCTDGSDESYAHAQCSGTQDITACTFDDGGGVCRLSVDGWIADTVVSTGLGMDHTYRGVKYGRFLYSEYTKQDYVSATRSSISADILSPNKTYCLRFYYYMSSRVGDFYVTWNTSAGKTIGWIRRGSQAVAWVTAELLIEPSILPISEITFEVYNTPETVRSVGLDDISIIEGQCVNDDISCTFSDGLCGWRHYLSLDIAVWTRAQRVPTIRYTGPSIDHTDGYGYFLYFNSSDYRQGQIARLVSRPVSQGSFGAYCFQFWYHMWGVGMGALRVYTVDYTGTTNVVWQQTVPQENRWIMGSVTLDRIKTPYEVMLEAERGSTEMSDMAFDDIQLIPGYCGQNTDYGGLDPRSTPGFVSLGGPWGSDPAPPTRRPVSTCGRFETLCTSGQGCYMPSQRCDGIPDCDDESDEYACLSPIGDRDPSPPGRCLTSEYRCGTSPDCIPSYKVCDGVINCQDRSDESPSKCKTGGGLMYSQDHTGISASSVIGIIIAIIIVIFIVVIAFIIIMRRRAAQRMTGRSRAEGAATISGGGNLMPSLLPRPPSPPKYADLTPPPYSVLDDKDGGHTSPPPYDQAIAADLSSPKIEAAQGQPNVEQNLGQTSVQETGQSQGSPERRNVVQEATRTRPVQETEC